MELYEDENKINSLIFKQLFKTSVDGTDSADCVKEISRYSVGIERIGGYENLL